MPSLDETSTWVIGVEPDPELLWRAADRCDAIDNVEVRMGAAETAADRCAQHDIAHARFAYSFGDGAEAGLLEVERVLRPDGVPVVVDNDWRYGKFAELLHDATGGSVDADPDATDRWWSERGAVRIGVEGGWRCQTPQELEAILRFEFRNDVVDRFIAGRPEQRSMSYGFAVLVWRSPG